MLPLPFPVYYHIVYKPTELTGKEQWAIHIWQWFTLPSLSHKNHQILIKFTLKRLGHLIGRNIWHIHESDQSEGLGMTYPVIWRFLD